MRLSNPKLADRIDCWVAARTPMACVPPDVEENRYVEVKPTTSGMAGIWANIHAIDVGGLRAAFDALAATVCPNDPRTMMQRRSEAGRRRWPRGADRLDVWLRFPGMSGKGRRRGGTGGDPRAGRAVHGRRHWYPRRAICPASGSSRPSPSRIRPRPPSLPPDPARQQAPARVSALSGTRRIHPLAGSDLAGGPAACDGVRHRPHDALSGRPDSPVQSQAVLPCSPPDQDLLLRSRWLTESHPDGTITFTAPTGHRYRPRPPAPGFYPALATPTGDLDIAPGHRTARRQSWTGDAHSGTVPRRGPPRPDRTGTTAACRDQRRTG